jgi:hypothetical protein
VFVITLCGVVDGVTSPEGRIQQEALVVVGPSIPGLTETPFPIVLIVLSCNLLITTISPERQMSKCFVARTNAFVNSRKMEF